MKKARNSLLIALVVFASIPLLSLSAQAVELMPTDDNGWVIVNGSSGVPRPDPGPTTGEPDVTGNGAPSKGSNSTSLQRSPSESPSPTSDTLRLLFRFWLARFPWTWR